MKIYELTPEMRDGKYLVVRRDGTIPEWPHFVLSARDPAAPEALRTYAYRCSHLGMDRDYTDSAWDLSRVFEDYHKQYGSGDPAEAPNRIDNSLVISMMRRETDLTGLGHTPRARDDIEYIGALRKIVRLTSEAISASEGETHHAFSLIMQTAQDVLRAHVEG
jgi:hypothetical protein